MLKILFLVMMTIAASSPLNAEPLESFFGLRLGIGMKEVGGVLESKGMKATTVSEGNILASGGIFNGRPITSSMFFQSDLKLSGMLFVFGPFDDIDLISTFKRLSAEVADRYPEAHFEDQSEFLTPYKDGDGYEIFAVSIGKAKIRHVWFFDSKRFISVSLTKDRKVTLIAKATDLSEGPAKSDF